MKIITCLVISSLLFFAACSKKASIETAPNKPNILFLLADDLGYGELGIYGQKMIQTPVIDQLARDGMRFTNSS